MKHGDLGPFNEPELKEAPFKFDGRQAFEVVRNTNSIDLTRESHGR